MVDRDLFPSDTMSTHFMSPLAVGELQKLGLVDQVLAAGFRQITRHRAWIGDVAFEGPAGPFGLFSLAPRRSVIDTILVSVAVEAGVHFAQRTRAERLVFEGTRVAGAILQTAGGERREVRARVVVGADGKYSKVADWAGAEKYDAEPALRPVYMAYIRGVVPMLEPTLEMFYGGDQVGFLLPMRPGEDCLALEVQPADFDAFRKDPEGEFLGRYRRLPLMAKRLGAAVLEGKVQGTKGIENYFRKPYGEGWALTGDAGYLKDPSTGLGMGDALAASSMLAEALAGWLGGADWESSMAGFQARRDRHFKPFYEATLEYTRAPDLAADQLAWLQGAFTNPHLSRALAGAVAGEIHDLLGPKLAQIEPIARLFGATPAQTRV